MPALLAVKGLSKSYQGVRAVDDVSFEVNANEIAGIIGPNGSGKSTTVDCITGFQRADRGDIRIENAILQDLTPWRIARAGLMRTFQTVRVYEQLTLEENLLAAMAQFDATNWMDALFRTPRLRAADKAARERARALVQLAGLVRYWEAPVGILSYGQKKLVALISALMPKPKLVILDEPVAGVNPARIRDIESAIRLLRAEGETFLIIEHNMEFIMNLCDRVIVFDQGRKLTEGTPQAVHADPRVLEAYLGVRA